MKAKSANLHFAFKSKVMVVPSTLNYNTLLVTFSDCPKGWHQVRHACYRAFKTDDLQFKTVFHAQVKCREYGAHLASIPSREIEKEVAEYLHTLVRVIKLIIVIMYMQCYVD